MKSYPAPNKPALLRTSVLLSALFASAALLQAQPTDNPVTKFYPGATPGYVQNYDWTNEIQWGTVIDITANPYGANADPADSDSANIYRNSGTDQAAVQSAIDGLSADGGGVIYFPPGVYNFNDDLILKSGVVLRGLQPDDGYVADNLDPNYDPENPAFELDNAKSSLFTLFAQFKFPKFHFDKTANAGTGNSPSTAFKAIKADNDYTIENTGVVWIEITGARIELVDYPIDGNGFAVDANGDGSSYFEFFGVPFNNNDAPDAATNFKNNIQSRNIVILGNRINNAGDWENRPGVSPPINSQDAWQIWYNRVKGVIEVYARENVIIANNRLSDWHLDHWTVQSTPYTASYGTQPDPAYIDDFLMKDYKFKSGTVAGNIWFLHTGGYGVKLNRSSGFFLPATPVNEPLLYSRNLTLRDNWAFVTSRVGYHAAGGGLEVIGNIRVDAPNFNDERKSRRVKTDGRDIASGAPTYECRGYDITGEDLYFGKNYWDVRQVNTGPASIDGSGNILPNTGAYYSTDGEGVLHQEVGGGTPVNGWTLVDNVGDAYMGIYKSRDIRDVTISGNTIDNNLFFVSDTNGPIAFSIENSTIEDNYFGGGGTIRGTAGIDNLVVQNNTGGALTIDDGGASLNPIPDVAFASPAMMYVVAPGGSIDFQIDATDRTDTVGGEIAPTAVEIFHNASKEGDAVLNGGTGFYELSVTAPATEGNYQYVARASGSPQVWYSKGLVVVVSSGGSPITVPVGVTVSFAGSDAQLAFDTESGLTYQLLKSTDNMATWPPVVGQSVAGDGTSKTLTDAGGKPSSGNKVFYRIEVTN